MENFQPTEDQLLEYYLDDLDDKSLQQKIAAYLKQNPAVAAELNDWAHLETTYQKTLAAAPSSQVLQNVRQMALQEMQKSQKRFGGFSSPAFLKKWALSFSVLLVIGSASWLVKNALPGVDTHNIDLAQNNGTTLQTSHLAAVSGSDAGNTTNGVDISLDVWAKQQLDSAITAFQNNDYVGANQQFAQIAGRYPEFSENQKLYTYWIESLKKVGQFELAAEKRSRLEELSQ